MLNLTGTPLYNQLEHFTMPCDTSIVAMNFEAVQRWGVGTLVSILYVNDLVPYYVVSKMGDKNWREN